MKTVDKRIRKGAVVQCNKNAGIYDRCLGIVFDVVSCGIKCYLYECHNKTETFVVPFDAAVYIGDAAYSLEG